MSEHRKIVALNRSGHADALVTLVHVEGSSYRHSGARLLVAGSKFEGTISGGCLEAEVLKKAAWMVRRGATLERYSTMFDDTAEISYGLGCGGTVTLLFEPAETPEYRALMHALEASLLGESLTVITWMPGSGIPGQPPWHSLARAILSLDGEVIFASPQISREELAAFAEKGESFVDASATASGVPKVFVERLVPPQRLVVFGAGDDAKPLVSMAALLGWTVLVADGRAQFARPERFPEADRVVTLPPGEIETLNLTAADAVILMTHSYEQDRDWLAAVLPVSPVYFGVLGAKHRSSLLVSEAAAMTGLSLVKCCERIFAPVGLDLGGDGPEPIALAVISEAHARCMGRLGSSLRLSATDVTAQIAAHAQSPQLPLCAMNPATGSRE